MVFKDITPLLADHDGLSGVIAALAAAGRDGGGEVVVDKVVGMEARGFILAAPVALALGIGFVPVRKAGKLPWAVVREEYRLEYGVDTIEIHLDAVGHAERILIAVGGHPNIHPGFDGVELSKRFRKSHPHTPVLFMSGYSDDTMAHHGLTVDQYKLLTKPFTTTNLLQKVREVLG